MAIPLLTMKPAGSRSRSGVVTPTITGDVPVVTVGGRSAWQVWEATTNLVPNPRFDASQPAMWQQYGASGGVVIDISATYEGCNALKHTRTASGFAGMISHQTTRYPVTAGLSYTFSCEIDHNLPGTKSYAMQIMWRDAANVGVAPTASSTVVVTPGQMIRQSFSAVAPVGAVTCLALVFSTSGANGEITWMFRPQVEQKAYATPFTPRYSGGVLQPGNTWSGTPHASTSTRAGGTVAATLASFTEVLVRYRQSGVTTNVSLTAPGAIGTYATLTDTGPGIQLSSTQGTDFFMLAFYNRLLTTAERTTALSAMTAGTLDFTTLHPIGIKQGGVLSDALAYKLKQGGVLVDVNIKA